MKKFSLNLPINSTSLGQTSTLILRTIIENPELLSQVDGLFHIGNEPDLSSQDQSSVKPIIPAIQKLMNDSLVNYDRKAPCFKLWHLLGSLESYSASPALMSFYELDQPTKAELTIAGSQNTIFTSKYTCEVFANQGVSTKYVPLAFDDFNFRVKAVRKIPDRITFNVVGKYEKRKSHEKVIKSWIKRFGNDRKYFLQGAVYNPFFPNPAETNTRVTNELLGGKSVFNVNFFGHMLQNSLYNDFLNSADIVLGMSGGEGWGLPEFQSVAMGKHAVILDAHGYKGWANPENAVLVKPSGKTPAYDGLFFREGMPFNQGNIFIFNEDEFIYGCEQAIKRVESHPVNTEGLKLQQEFSRQKMVSQIIEAL